MAYQPVHFGDLLLHTDRIMLSQRVRLLADDIILLLNDLAESLDNLKITHSCFRSFVDVDFVHLMPQPCVIGVPHHALISSYLALKFCL